MNVIEELIEAGRAIVAAGLVKGTGGNLSGREGEIILITRSGADLGRLTPADFVAIHPKSKIQNPKSVRPSSELAMHLSAYQARPEAQVVFHVHPPKAISLGLLGLALPALTPDFYLHLGPAVPLLPYITPTTEALAAAAGDVLRDNPAVLLQNHGVVVVGQSVAQAQLRLELLEEHAAIYLDALAGGRPRSLTAGEMRQLDEVTGGRYQVMSEKC
ncbi:MAG: class II aldolase/adducin family protein [Chloroflexota bacterium]